MLALAHTTALLVWVIAAVVILILLVARFHWNAFLALIVASLVVGLGSGMELPGIAKSFQEGVGRVLGDIGMIVGLGAVLGKLLAESGGAQVIADTLARALGERRLPWAVMLISFLVGIPVFFGVGLVLLVPIIVTLARTSHTPLLRLALPMVAALSVAHGLIPPHPGPMAAVGLLRGPDGPADLGRIILWSLLIGVPTAVIAGPLIAPWLARNIRIALPELAQVNSSIHPAARNSSPSFVLTVLTILLPVALMLFATAADILLPAGDTIRHYADFLGSPLVAMTVSVVFALWSFGVARGFDGKTLLRFSNECLGPVAVILLVVGAGGGFNRVLVTAGVGDAIASFVEGMRISPLLLGWVFAALIRLATGSATVAVTTAAGLMAPVIAHTPGVNLELLIITMGAGSLVLSHVNDGGFWLVKEFLGMTVTQTLRTWTVIETVISVVALLLALLLDIIF